MTSWNMVGNSNEGNDKKEINYLKFQEGTTILRVLDEAPYSRWTHWLGAPANGGKGVGVDCIGKGCPVCEIIAKEKAQGIERSKMKYSSKMTHSINVLVRKQDGSKEVSVLEQGNGLFGQLKDVMTMMGSAGMTPDLRNMDIMINRSGTGFNNTKYSVMPLMNKVAPLTQDELALEKYNLSELKPKLEAYQIIQIMNGSKFDEVVGGEKETEQQTTQNNGFDVDFTQAIQ